MKTEMSNGELVDKLTILEIKLKRISNKRKLVNLRREYNELSKSVSLIIPKDSPLYLRLYDINCKLWDLENHIRELERQKDFGNDFIQTARSVYFTNDKRSEVKREINKQTGSKFIEEKNYEKYD